MLGSSRPRILIADDHALIAEAFNKLLFNDFDVVATVHDGRSLMLMAERLRPDVILVDIGMPILNGLEAAQRIKRVLPEVKVIYVTINHDPSLVAEAFRRGASGYLSKSAAASELIAAIRHALSGDRYVSARINTEFSNSSTQSKESLPIGPRLTDRQIEVLQLLAEGKSMKEAAAVLNLTTRTVAFHKYRIMENLQLRNDAEVVQYAVRNHVIFS
jgi:DNA-binding NarL/FixJ family response regulator